MLVSLTGMSGANDWPQVQFDAQHTGYNPETLTGTGFQIDWRHSFQPERVYPQVQAIVHSGKVFVPTLMGNLYAFDANNGNEVWVFNAGKPIRNSVAAEDGRVFFGCLDGAIYCLDVNTGEQIWKKRLSDNLGFTNAPLIADGKVMIGGRDGTFYAIDPVEGNVVWQYDIVAPILQTAAWNDGKVYFGAMDLRVYALNSTDGSLAWKSDPVDAYGFMDYWPVVCHGKVIVRALAHKQLDLNFNPPEGSSSWLQANGPTVAAGNLTSCADFMAHQDQRLATWEANRSNYKRSLFVLDEQTGMESFLVPHGTLKQTMSGTPTPPCLDKDGLLTVNSASISSWHSGWARLDLSSHKFVDVLYDHYDTFGNPWTGNMPAGFGNEDENLNCSSAGNFIFGMHTEETNANYTGAFDLVNRRWRHISSSHANHEMTTNTQGGGGNPASIANGKIYHITWHNLIVRSAVQ